MIITSCGNSERLAKELARILKVSYSPLTISTFPDGDTYLKFNSAVNGRNVILVQSFQPHPEQSLLHVVFAAETAKNLGARKVILAAPYLAYVRQDKRFNPGEAVSSKIMGKMLSSCIDKVITIDPHLHRYKSLKEIFSCKAVHHTSNDLIALYIKKNVVKPVIVGPDVESSQWAAEIAQEIGADSTVFAKKRYSSWKVRVEMVQPLSLKGRNVVIIDDIISTGKTVMEAAKLARKKGAKSITAICVHGLFVGKAIVGLKKAGVSRIVSTNCIEHATNKIDVAPLLIEELEKEKIKL